MATTRRTKSKIPRFKDRGEEARFWDTHDTTEFEDEFTEVRLNARRPLSHILGVRLDSGTMQELTKMSGSRGVGPSTLVRQWVLDKTLRHSGTLAGGDSTVQTAVREIRAFINEPRRRYTRLKNRALWIQLCTSMNVIDDCEEAIKADRLEPETEHVGTRYLRLFGLLQALFVQQDAIRDLSDALGLADSVEEFEALKAIRNLRNDATGHPTKRGPNPKAASYHLINRSTLRSDEFELLSDYADGRSARRRISIPQLIEEQRAHAAKQLKAVAEKLEADDAEHRQAFSAQRLATSFDGVDVWLGELSDSLPRPLANRLKLSALESVEASLDKFVDGLNRRGISLQTYDDVNWDHKHAKNALRRLHTYYKEPRPESWPEFNPTDAETYVRDLDKSVAGLRRRAQEIDRDFSA